MIATVLLGLLAAAAFKQEPAVPEDVTPDLTPDLPPDVTQDVTGARTAGAGIELRGVSKHYGISQDQQVAAADDLSRSIAAGSFVAVTGASGSGKSMLLHLIGAIERPDRGSVTSDGTELTRLRATRGMTIVLASHDMQIAARSERLLRLRDGVLEQDIDLTEGYQVQDVIRRASQLG